MPRRPPRQQQRRSRFSRPQPLAFSSFARAVSRLRSKCSSSTKSHPKPPSKTSHDNHVLKDKNKIQQPESSDGDDHEDIIEATFTFFDPKPDDFHGVKILLQTYLGNEQWDLSGFVDLILGQTTVGTVVKIDDAEDDGLFSVVTALNLARYKDHQCVVELKEFLLKVCQEKDVMNELKFLLGENSRDVGLLVSQRVVNLPPQLLPPLYDALFDEVSWATEDEPTTELRDSFRFKSYLLLTRVYKNKHVQQQKGASKGNDSEPFIYIKPEDEIFHKLSSWSFTFPLHTQDVVTHELRNYRLMGLVMAVKEDKIPGFREELKLLVIESED